MSVVADVDLSEIIVSLAQAVTDANVILNTDPQSTMAITRFEVNTTLIATLSVPARQPASGVRLIRSGKYYRVSQFTPELASAARLKEWLQPSLLEAAIPTSQSEHARLEIRAVMEAVPNVSAG
jgi:hypothetical protein